MIIFFQQRYASRPAHLFGGIGLIAMFIGFGLGIYLVIVKYAYRQDIADRPLLLLAILLLIMGLQFIIFGIISDILIRIYYRDGRKGYKIAKILE